MGPSACHSAVIAVIGDVALDYTIEVHPGSGADEKKKVARSSRALGGTAANTAAQIVKLGTRAELVSVIGDDDTGEWLRRQLKSVGIGSKSIATRAGSSTFVTIVLEDFARNVYVDLGVGEEIHIENYEAIAAVDLIYVSYAPQVIRDLVRRGYGPRLVVGLEHWMTDADVLEASKQARLIITNSAGLNTLDLDGFGDVVVTHGAAGVELRQHGRLVESIPAVLVDAVDATGAGDSFAGALCHSIANGDELVESIRFAAAVAALSTLAVGAQEAQPTMGQVKSFGQ